MLTYRYKLYSSKRNRKIDAMLLEACFVWNHALALQKRYYRLWGRKMADLAFGSFVQKLEHTASKYGCEVRKVDRYYPSSRTCGCCGYVYEHLDLRDREWTCPQCGTTLDRDVNAATNIMRQGIASSGSPRKTKVTLRKGR